MGSVDLGECWSGLLDSGLSSRIRGGSVRGALADPVCLAFRTTLRALGEQGDCRGLSFERQRSRRRRNYGEARVQDCTWTAGRTTPRARVSSQRGANRITAVGHCSDHDDRKPWRATTHADAASRSIAAFVLGPFDLILPALLPRRRVRRRWLWRLGLDVVEVQHRVEQHVELAEVLPPVARIPGEHNHPPLS